MVVVVAVGLARSRAAGDSRAAAGLPVADTVDLDIEWLRIRLFLQQKIYTECPKIYRSILKHLLKYTANLYLSRCSTDCGKFWDTQYTYLLFLKPYPTFIVKI